MLSRSIIRNHAIIRCQPRFHSHYNSNYRKFSTNPENPWFGKQIYLFIRSKLTFLHFVRAARIGFLGFAIYQAGYQTGLIHYAQDPHQIEKEMMKGVITATGADSYHPVYHPYHIQVKTVGERIVFAAKDMCKEKIETLIAENEKIHQEIEAYNKAKSHHNQEGRKHNFPMVEKIAENEAEILVWKTALSRLKGSWHYVVIAVPSINAFVTAACPRRVFVHSVLMEKLKPTDDELALVIGHEISHFLLEHVEKEQSYNVTLKILQLMLLSFIEPVGILSVLYDFLIAGVATYLDASYSRECEEEADELGMELAARACFDTKKSTKIFQRLSAALTGSPGPDVALFSEVPEASKDQDLKKIKKDGSNPLQATNPPVKRKANWNDTHPHWDERIENVNNLSDKFNPDKYRTCHSYLRYYMESITTTITGSNK